jgi:hypothetical protein
MKQKIEAIRKRTEKLLNQENDKGRLKYMYQFIRTNPTFIGKECMNKMYLES